MIFVNDEINSLAIQDNLSNEDIKNLIYTIKGKQVMLDSDVARLYHYETRRINETVKRNIERFPIEFCFQLTTKEYETLKSQFATSNNTRAVSYTHLKNNIWRCCRIR